MVLGAKRGTWGQDKGSLRVRAACKNPQDGSPDIIPAFPSCSLFSETLAQKESVQALSCLIITAFGPGGTGARRRAPRLAYGTQGTPHGVGSMKLRGRTFQRSQTGALILWPKTASSLPATVDGIWHSLRIKDIMAYLLFLLGRQIRERLPLLLPESHHPRQHAVPSLTGGPAP